MWWLVNNDFMPFHYVEDRAAVAARWYQYLLFPLQWAGGQLLYLAADAGLAGVALPAPRTVNRGAASADAAFNRRYVGALALGPFAVTTAVAALLGRQPIAMWGYPLWSFAPLAVLMVWPPSLEPAQLRRFAGAAVAVLIAFPIAFAAAELGEPFIRDRSKATQFSGRFLADTIARQWRERTGTPLTYVGGAIVIDNARGFPRELRGRGDLPRTMSRSIRRIGRTSSSTVSSSSAPGSMPPISNAAARSCCGTGGAPKGAAGTFRLAAAARRNGRRPGLTPVLADGRSARRA